MTRCSRRRWPRSFQFTPPCGGGPTASQPDSRNIGFQFTPPCGGGPTLSLSAASGWIFQFTPPCGGGRTSPRPSTRHGLFQFTPPCGGGAARRAAARRPQVISIHAPVWGRAVPPLAPCRCTYYFNSRPRVGAGVRGSAQPRKAHKNFNSRPRVGASPNIAPRRMLTIDISIHAPVWGRAQAAALVYLGVGISIHAPVWGRATRPAGSRPRPGQFQFTPPCGGGPVPAPA